MLSGDGTRWRAQEIGVLWLRSGLASGVEEGRCGVGHRSWKEEMGKLGKHEDACLESFPITDYYYSVRIVLSEAFWKVHVDLLNLYDLFKINMPCSLEGSTPISPCFQPTRASWGIRHWTSVRTACCSGCQCGLAARTTFKVRFPFSP